MQKKGHTSSISFKRLTLNKILMYWGQMIVVVCWNKMIQYTWWKQMMTQLYMGSHPTEYIPWRKVWRAKVLANKSRTISNQNVKNQYRFRTIRGSHPACKMSTLHSKINWLKDKWQSIKRLYRRWWLFLYPSRLLRIQLSLKHTRRKYLVILPKI